MANVDDELAEAVRESEQAAQAEPAPVAVPVPGAPSPRPKRSLGLLVGLIVMGGAVLMLIFTTFEPTYSRKVDEVTRDKQKLSGRNLRVEGTLKRCSLTRRDEPCEFRFTM